MNKIKLVIVLCLLTQLSFAQKHNNLEALNEDFKIFESIIKNGHPALYEYIDNDSLNYVFEDTKESLQDGISNIAFYKKMLDVTNKIKDAKLQLFLPETIGTDRYYFPLIVKIINSNFYTDTSDFEIPIGSKIISINDRKASVVIEQLKKYVPTYGNNLTRKYREIESNFGLYFAYEYGIHKKFIITYITPDGVSNNRIIPAESFIKVTRRSAYRNSYFANFHKQQNGFDFFNSYIDNKTPFVFYKNELSTAIIVINSFNGNNKVFKSNLSKIFKDIKKKKIQHLIIDIRRNTSGFRANAIQLYSFITNNTFKQRTDEYIASLSIPEKKHANRVFFNEKQFLKDKFSHHPIYDGWKITFDDLETIMVPHKNRFTGKVYVLVGGSTFSEASNFALNVKNDTQNTLIGEETGGGYYYSTGEFPVYYELPNSKIGIMLYMEKINHYIKDKSIPKGTGILPDKNIILTVDDLIMGKDPELDYLFRLIKG